MTEYAVERWVDVKGEISDLLVRHWKEVALDHSLIPLDIDHEKYDNLDEMGAFHVVTARRDGKVIGYHMAIIQPHLHYASTLFAFTDVYFIAPECRHGITAMRLFQFVEKSLKDRGVLKLITSVKLHMDNGNLFERMGYRPFERMYSKILKG